MKINLKARLKNKTFVLSALALIVAFVYQILSLFGVTPTVSENEIMNIVTMALNILAFMGVLVDPTTDGMGDSERAMTYHTNYDIRAFE